MYPRLASLARNQLTSFQTIAEVYRPGWANKVEKVLEVLREKSKEAAQSQIGQKLKIAKEYAKVEMAPPSANEIPRLQADLKLLKDFVSTGCYKYLTVKQAWLIFLVGLEISLWFYLGETIGKFHIIGYKV